MEIIVEQDGIIGASSHLSEAELKAEMGAAVIPEKTSPAKERESAKESPDTADRRGSDHVDTTASDGTDHGDAAGGADGKEGHDRAVAAESTTDTDKTRREKRGESIQARIDRIVYERKEEERRLEAAKKDREQAEAAAKPVTPSSLKPFKDFAVEYAAAHPDATYEDVVDAHMQQRETAFMERVERMTAEKQQHAEIEGLKAAHAARFEAMVKADPSVQEAITETDALLNEIGYKDLPPVLYHAILRSEKSADIQKDLVTHHEDLIDLVQTAAQMPATLTSANVMRMLLEQRVSGGSTAQVTGPVPPRQSRTSPPPKPVGSSPSVSDRSLDEMSYDAFKAKFDKEIWNPQKKRR